MTVLYIAGPMTGHRDSNHPAFIKAAAALTDAGYQVRSPHTILLGPAEQPTWDAYMRHAIRMMTETEGVALLPGWLASRGARIEHNLAIELGMIADSVAYWLGYPVQPGRDTQWTGRA